jgi:hypothetical protein
MIRTLIATTAAVLLASSAASAAPATSALPKELNASAAAPGITKVQYRKNRKYRGHRKYRRHYRGGRYYHGRRYRGYRRYGSRPWNWRARGCFVVGPIWFCP